MGSSQTKYPVLTEDVLEDYTMLTYLSKGEIYHVLKKFHSIDPEKVNANLSHRFPKEDILRKFDVLKNNPYQDRMFRVFSSQKDDCLSFEDILDMCSVMSPDCPPDVKASWAFRIFDIDEDNQITKKDIINIIDRLTWDPTNRANIILREDKIKIANIILDEIKLDHSGGIGFSEFKFIISRVPELSNSFYFRL
ncbi:calcium and integrin-binding protein 1-like [Leptidea sinapis]|uniref:EF-hand domain-containing protein n=1 Tax=Leptidea sinapis TaxID=189913 RepID=A0A5E4R2L3_9NEOP|nr:calcium and integrin-binding protein 1-like [Leptidea sinapis]VVD04741.1 unnamed protein product [Leptidea sinapis]